MEKQRIVHLTAKDFKVQTFRSGGKGGQHQNKTDSGVRIVHRESGAVAECREERSQYQNKRKAFEKLTSSDRFRTWLKREHNRMCGLIPSRQQIEKEVDAMIEKDLANGNIKIEEV